MTTEIAACWLPLPPTSNNAYVNVQRGRARSQALKDWVEAAGWTWKAQGTFPARPLDRRQTWGWSGTFYFSSLGGRDLDNSTKHIVDLIVGVVFGGHPDDRYLVWQEHWKRVSGGDTGVLVRVYEVNCDELGPPGVVMDQDVGVELPDPGPR